MRKDLEPDKINACRAHGLVYKGVCPACKVAEDYEHKIAMLEDRIHHLEGTIDSMEGRL